MNYEGHLEMIVSKLDQVEFCEELPNSWIRPDRKPVCTLTSHYSEFTTVEESPSIDDDFPTHKLWEYQVNVMLGNGYYMADIQDYGSIRVTYTPICRHVPCSDRGVWGTYLIEMRDGPSIFSKIKEVNVHSGEGASALCDWCIGFVDGIEIQQITGREGTHRKANTPWRYEC